MSIEDEHSAPKPSTRREFHVLSHLTNTVDPKFHETAIAYFVKRIPDLLKTEKEKNFDISTPSIILTSLYTLKFGQRSTE